MATEHSPINYLQLDKQLCFALYSTSLAMTKLYKPLLEKLGLTYPQYLVMLILWEGDGLALKDIAEQLHIDSGALTPVIKRLETQGLLQRQRQADNERTLEIGLTPAGRALREQAQAVPLAVGVACATPEAEIHALREQLQQLRKNLIHNT
ncbi:MarR family winged helix-turn-helix transcriptional regulator [Cellvibrio sp. PSBB023]|uniref:MarR family winged helix-turn-helix transcriptional regulator n=1 Tax=Cellvibrio sp. PSBB023 TaxID=1945512 RepID=UPI00098F42D6|nr:MarR family transcriptional regulator [Cellvibrio sp. PSBB023]AQT61135.1 MarR family transcriptional regulator [Cellvibrio sp. PSBB023]